MTHLTAINPRTGVSDYSFEAASVDQVRQTVESARVAQKAWAESGLEHRVRVMNLFADALVEFGDSLREALTIDTGRKKISAEEVDAVYHMTHGHAANAPKILAHVSGPSSNVPDVDFIQQYVA